MKDIENIIGKEYDSNLSGEAYSFRGLFKGIYPDNYSIETCGLPFAEDSSGNLYTTKNNGKIYFWDHETDDTVLIANSYEDLLGGLKEPSSIELREDQVKSVWIDPEFAKQFGIEAPADGWNKGRHS